MADKILLLDSNSLIHRAYHALPNLRTSGGLHTGAMFGFFSILIRLIKEQKPTHIAAAFDLKGPTFRNDLYDGYKATRKPMDNELKEQFEPIKKILQAMNIKIVSKSGFEGDDILGTLAKRFKEDTVIVTGDRDSFQLVDKTTKIFWTKKGVSEIEVYDVKRLLEDGFTPSQFIDYKALAGDSSDNIPGVAGIGDKTAKGLLKIYGSLDEALAHAGQVGGKAGENLKNQKDTALLSRKLAEIYKNVPIECTLDDIAFTPIFSAEVKKLLNEYEMSSLISRLTFETTDGEDGRGAAIQKEVVEITTKNDLKNAIKGDKIALIIDENIRFSTDISHEYIIKCVDDLFSEGINFDDALNIVKEDVKNKKLVCYDYKSMLKKYGVEAAEFFDVMIAAHLARYCAPIKNINAVFNPYGYEAGAVEMLVLADKFAVELQESELTKLFYEVEQPLALVLEKMEERGFSMSTEKLSQLQVKFDEKLKRLSSEIYGLAGTDFNIGSPKQLGEILFDRLGLKHGKKTKTGYSVSEDVLDGLKNEHQIVGKILEWRHYAKLQSTYVTGLQPLIVKGKIHTEFNQCITTTGRLSSTNPNLQNIPVRREDAKDVKSAFTASDGCVLVSADYSQIELRLLAAMSGDEKLIEAYNRADDIHAITASEIFDIPISEVTPANRRDAKAVNFGIIYGISGFGLAENLSIPQYKAKQFIERYFETYPTVKAFIEKNVATARECGYAVTMLGRRRGLSDLSASNYLLRSSAERMAMNTPLQGTAAEVVKLAMLGVEKRLDKMKSKMILQVHDELIVDADKSEVEQVKKILEEEMEHAVELAVPLIVDIETGDNWGEL